MTTSPAARAIGFCTRFFAQLQAGGLETVVISPGSRSTPLVLAAEAVGLEVVVAHDERSGAFFALGAAKARRGPAALVSTSGTAAANSLPAVVEAAHSGVPLLVLTADRPPESRGWGPGQTIDQSRLYGSNARWFFEAPPASEAPSALAAQLGARALLEASRGSAGPIHINFPFRKPLVDADFTSASAEAVANPIGATASAATPAVPRDVAVVRALLQDTPRGLLVAGPGDLTPDDVAAVAEVARRAGWPIIAEPTSQLRSGPHVADAQVVASADVIVRAPKLAVDLAPDAVMTIGSAPTSKAVRRWLATVQPEQVVVTSSGRDLADPDYLATSLLSSPGAAIAAALVAEGFIDRDSDDWTGTWRDADQMATAEIEKVLRTAAFSEPSAIRTIADTLPSEAALYVSNSLPVRDVDLVWPASPRETRVFCHRGAAGIDGLVSAAAGAAAVLDAPTVLIAGDLAFLHDIGGAMMAARLGLPLVIVVLDNGGGAIFDQLPEADVVPPSVFTRLYTAPHQMDIPALAAAAGLDTVQVATVDELSDALHTACAAAQPALVYASVEAHVGYEVRRAMANAVARL